MINDPNLVLYACVSKGTMVLAEISSGDKELEDLALQCLEKTPNLHAMFSHTIGKRIYSFLMEDPFVYFAIADEKLGTPEGLGFLKRVKDAFMKVLQNEQLKNLDDLTSYCFHRKLTPIFHKLLSYSGEINVLPPPPPYIPRDGRNASVDSRSGNLVVAIPLLEKHAKKKNHKKRESEGMSTASREIPIESMVHVPDDSREFSVPLQKNRLHARQQGQKMWRRYIWTALLIDIVLCSVLLGVWLWICTGFQCLRE